MQQFNITHKGSKGIYSIYEIEYNAKNEIQMKIKHNPSKAEEESLILTIGNLDYFKNRNLAHTAFSPYVSLGNGKYRLTFTKYNSITT